MIIEYTSILDHILNIHDRTASGGRPIEYIALSESEVQELNRELHSDNKITYNDKIIMGKLFGVNIAGLTYHTNRLKDKILKEIPNVR